MPDKSQFTELDFFTIKEELKNYLKGQNRFLDYDFEGSNMSVVLDILSQNTFLNNFYTNMAFSEMFLDTAQLRNSLISHAKELNYLPRSRRAPRAKLLVELINIDQFYGNNNRPSYIIIPQYTVFSGKKNGVSYTFSTDEQYIIAPDSTGAYCRSDVFVYEGSVQTENFLVTGPEQKFILSNDNVDTSSIKVKVRQNTNLTSNKEEYKFKESLFGARPDDKFFYLEADLDDKYQIVFGRDIFGKNPAVNSVVEISYRITNGELANGINTFSTSPLLGPDDSPIPAQVLTVAASEGGSEKESIESIRFYAPKSLAAQERAVTERDYEVLLKNRFPEIQTVAVYGGEEADPPQFGRVIVSVDVFNAQGASETSKVQFANFLKERSPLSIEPIVVSAQFMHLYVTTNVYYNTTKGPLSISDVRKKVIDTLKTYSDDNLNEFGKTVNFSKLTTAIDDADVNILSNETQLKALIEFSPDVSPKNYTILFKNELAYDYLNSSNVSIYQPAITSSVFDYNGEVAYMQDDGNGNINIVKYSQEISSFVYLNKKAGTIDYTTGKVSLNDFYVDNDLVEIVTLYANVKSKNIKTPKERIVSIRGTDINLTVLGTRQ